MNIKLCKILFLLYLSNSYSLSLYFLSNSIINKNLFFIFVSEAENRQNLLRAVKKEVSA